VPLIWRGPKGAPENKGRQVNRIVENTDLMPSILECAGIPVPEGVQGRSFVPLARGAGSSWKDRCFSQLHSGMFAEGDYKLIDNSLDGAGPWELYDLRNDPKEERDLSADPRHRDRVAYYRKQIAGLRAYKPSPVRIAGMSTPDYAELSGGDAAPAPERKRGRRRAQP
jgi:arylsulfatase A-like enzyme